MRAIDRDVERDAREHDRDPVPVRRLAAQSTLDRFPHVGAIVAAASAAQTHEWERYRRGVFTHELLSGLRGAADVNGDGRIEYSEVSAFIAAANRSIVETRARPDVVTRPPSLDRRAAIVDLSRLRRRARLEGNAGALGELWIEDARGNRLADVHAEDGFRVALSLPPAEPLYVRTRAGEAELTLALGARVPFDALAFHRPESSARGAVDASLQRGIFANPFGPVYYRGFVDAHPAEFLAVPSGSDRDRPAAPVSDRPRWPGWLAVSLGAGAAVGAGVFTIRALDAKADFDAARFERPSAEARDRLETDRTLAIGLGAAAVVGLAAGAILLLTGR